MLAQQLNRRFTEWMLPIASGANAASTRLDGGSLGGALAARRRSRLRLEPLLGAAARLGADTGCQRRRRRARRHHSRPVRHRRRHSSGRRRLRFAGRLQCRARLGPATHRRNQEGLRRLHASPSSAVPTSGWKRASSPFCPTPGSGRPPCSDTTKGRQWNRIRSTGVRNGCKEPRKGKQTAFSGENTIQSPQATEKTSCPTSEPLTDSFPVLKRSFG